MSVNDVLARLYNIYMYPARFPAKIFDLFFSKVEPRGFVFDPFAGSGSLAIAAYLKCLDSEVWDLNPMIHVMVDSSVKVIGGYSVRRVLGLLEEARHYGKPWLPRDASFWWSEKTLDLLGRIWGYFRDNMAAFRDRGSETYFEPLDNAWSLYAVIALYASRRLSYTDDNVPKWFRSKYKRSRIEELLGKHTPESLFQHYVEMKARRIARAEEAVRRPQCNPNITVRALDAVEARDYPEEIVGVLTSPPYIQAQEYIRSFQGELLLLGVPRDTVMRLKRLEIPYRPPAVLEIESPSYEEIVESVEPRFKKLFQSYFTNTLLILERTVENMIEKAVLGVFVGNATIGGKPIPIARIIKEHLVTKLRMNEVERGSLEDRIRRRRLFKGRRNLNPNGIEVEHLIFLERKSTP